LIIEFIFWGSNKYTYEIANDMDEVEAMLEADSYRFILIDKELDKLELHGFREYVEAQNEPRDLQSIIILTQDSQNDEDESIQYVDKVIKNIANKDALKSIFDEFNEIKDN
jgi:DNA-binding response OmpR family regulator